MAAKVENPPAEDEKFVSEIPVALFTRNMRWCWKQKHFISVRVDKFAPQVMHVHGVLTFIQRSSIRVANQKGIPVLVSPHGMLEPWLWTQNGPIYYWLKRLYWVIVLRPFIRRADYVHAITDQEAETLAKAFPGVPQINISNAIDLSEYGEDQVSPDSDRYLLFIGRLHPKKGVDLLIEAFNKLEAENFYLVIAGPDFDANYTASLKALAKKYGLSETVLFVGSVHGEQKSELLEKAWCTVIPSYSDVVALVNLESAASFTPTITTTMTGLSNWQEGGGLLVEPELEALTQAITTVCQWKVDERMQKGKRAREFVEQRYSWDVIGEQWIEAYKMIAKSGKKKHG